MILMNTLRRIVIRVWHLSNIIYAEFLYICVVTINGPS